MEDEYLNAPESECLLKHIKERIEKKKGIIFIFTGGTGEGKSYAGLRLLEKWYDLRFNEGFPLKYVCNNVEEAILLVKDFERKGEGIMIEELSVHAGVRESLTTKNILFNQFIDICRVKQAIIVGNTPHISFIDKHVQMMCQSWVNCESVDFKRKIVKAHPLWLQTSPHKNEPYKHKYIDEEGEEIDECFFKLAEEELIFEYEELKTDSNEEIFDKIILKFRYDKKKQLAKLGQKTLSSREMESYQLYLDGYDSKESAEKMGLKHRATYTNYLISAKKKLKQAEYSYIARKLGKTNKCGKKVSKTMEESHIS